ncbi:hypothetical protein F3Y22_tig00110937pilonHSYRG00036 [Hibiscus syriacus]|uniref:RNase H type-1 domain-containing protein n=1 Tax=Hibiscus syriacus TaxID=106335 RepID=A0A6A2ZCI7_HIBSY|nr:hypothetical protein F3Y22_tig00110937pilonHSYRG00036 [Hibiscus syriacus]
MTNAERMRRHFTANSRCPLCLGMIEDLYHLLRLCPSALAVWSSLVRRDRLHEFITMELTAWIAMNLENASDFVGLVADWDMFFGSIIWNLWLYRNSVAFGYPLKDSRSVLEPMVAAFARAWSMRSLHNRTRVPTGIGNDGGSLTLMELVGLTRARRRVVLSSEMMRVSGSWGFQKILVEVDSLEALKEIPAAGDGFIRLTIIAYIIDLLQCNWAVTLHHVSGQGNQVADCMTKLFRSDVSNCLKFVPLQARCCRFCMLMPMLQLS